MALIPPVYLNSLVSIGVEKKDENGDPQFASIATGFLVGEPTGESNEQGPLFKIFLVTNRHVFYDEKKDQFLSEVLFRFNTQDQQSHHFRVKLLEDGAPIWSKHENNKVDLAVLPLNAKVINEAKIDYFFFTNEDSFYARDFPSKNISTGDSLFVLGFPMSISGKMRNFVIVRQGIIARVDEEVLEEGFYYIDASAFPGNSGGPVVVKPEVVSIHGTKSNNSAGLIGVISSGETYSDVAVSKQTGEAKIIFTEQTGLVRVVPIELVQEIITKIMKTSAPVAKIEDASEVEDIDDATDS